MSVKRTLTWLFLRNTSVGRTMLGTSDPKIARRMGAIANRATEKAQAQRGRDLQYVDDDCRVEVKQGYSRDHGQVTTDILILPRDGSGDRYHVVIDEHGREIYNNYHPGKH